MRAAPAQVSGQRLSDLGFGSTSLVVDDEWTAATTAAVKTFQRWMGMEVDGRLALGDGWPRVSIQQRLGAHHHAADAVPALRRLGVHER